MEPAEKPNPVRVLLVEDSATVREAVASEFRPGPDFEIVGEAASLSEARSALATADVVILDLGLPDGSGADLIRDLRDVNPKARAIVLTSAFDPALHARATECGAAAVLDKITQLGGVAQAVRRILDMPEPVARERAAPWAGAIRVLGSVNASYDEPGALGRSGRCVPLEAPYGHKNVIEPVELAEDRRGTLPHRPVD
jgi:DNA-binding NtrC family response regulator